MTTPKSTPWYETYTEVVRLARWMAKEHGFNKWELLGYLDKPYNWTDEYEQMLHDEAGDTAVMPSPFVVS